MGLGNFKEAEFTVNYFLKNHLANVLVLKTSSINLVFYQLPYTLYPLDPNPAIAACAVLPQAGRSRLDLLKKY